MNQEFGSFILSMNWLISVAAAPPVLVKRSSKCQTTVRQILARSNLRALEIAPIRCPSGPDNDRSAVGVPGEHRLQSSCIGPSCLEDPDEDIRTCCGFFCGLCRRKIRFLYQQPTPGLSTRIALGPFLSRSRLTVATLTRHGLDNHFDFLSRHATLYHFQFQPGFDLGLPDAC